MIEAIEVTKVKINEKFVLVAFEQNHFTEDDRILTTKVPLKSEVKPHKDFFNRFQNLKGHAIALLELTGFKKEEKDKKVLEKHTVTTLNVWREDGGLQVMISINRHLKIGTLSLTVPMIDLDNCEHYDNLKELKELVEDILREAEQYAKGEKHGEDQLELNFEAVSA